MVAGGKDAGLQGCRRARVWGLMGRWFIREWGKLISSVEFGFTHAFGMAAFEIGLDRAFYTYLF